MKIDLSEAYRILHDADKAISVLDGVDFSDPESYRSKGKADAGLAPREVRAKLTRDLLHLEHLLEAAAQEVSRVYWKAKGYER